ncbi:MAG: alpha/beta fold hydrolase [Sulfitobacter sp.]
MSLLRINSSEHGLTLHGSAQPVKPVLTNSCTATRGTVIMVHGYKYAPYMGAHCPHTSLFGSAGWPQTLATRSDTLCVAFGWHARTGLARAYGRAFEHARELAGLIRALRPHGPVHVIAHSLGATLALAALPYLRRGDVGRIVLLNGAAHQGLAYHALETPAGHDCTLFHVTSRENYLFDLAFERLIGGTGAIARGLGAPQAHQIQISCPATLETLARLGYPLAQPARRVCHWSSYTRPGVMALNAALLEGRLTAEQLACALPHAPDTGTSWSLALRRKAAAITARYDRKNASDQHA